MFLGAGHCGSPELRLGYSEEVPRQNLQQKRWAEWKALQERKKPEALPLHSYQG